MLKIAKGDTLDRDAKSSPEYLSAGKVLLVDDEPSLRRLLGRYLSRAGFEVTEAADGIVALNLVRQQRFDALVSDIRMPRMGGLQLLEALIKEDPELPVVLMSASDEVPDTKTARQLGAFDFLPKPVNLMHLLIAVVRATEEHARRVTARRARPSAGRRSTILVVDDYDDARGALRDALEDAGHTVIEAANGQQALDLLVSRREPPIDLITLDLMMPVMDVFTFLELLHNYVRLSRIPVLIVSSQAEKVESDAHEAIVGRIKSPYEIRDLVKLVNGCVMPSSAAAPS